MSMVYPGTGGESMDTDEVLNRVNDLRDLNDMHLRYRHMTRAILNGGADAVQMLISDSDMEHLPAANLMHSGIERLAQKMIDVPTVRVDPPPTHDSAAARRRSEKRERIVDGYDRAARLQMQMPQAARWLAGYGFSVWAVTSGVTRHGHPFPLAELRDPFAALPGPWGVHQQPDDIAFIRQVPYRKLRRLYPRLPGIRPGAARRAWGGGLLLGSQTGSWESPNDTDVVRVVEYRNSTGTWMVLEEGNILLDFEETPEGMGTNFVVAKRFAFDQLIGQFHHAVGLQQMLARMNVLAFLSTSDDVFAETNVFGDMYSDKYRKGRGQINEFDLNSRVERGTGGSQNFEAFQQTDRLERQARLMGAYPVTDDSQSPSAWITGKGMQELTAGSDNVKEEYELVFTHALMDLDYKRLCYDQKMWPDLKRPIPGQSEKQTGHESYTPSSHIDSDFVTRRIYGILSGMDSSSKLVGMLQMAQAGWMDNLTAMENISGIDDPQKVRDRLDSQKAESMLEQAMMAAIQGTAQMDPRILRVLIDDLPEGPRKQRFEEVFFPEPEEGQEVDPITGAAMEPEPLAQPGEDPTTILSRLMSTGSTTSGVQTVQSVER